MKFSHRERLPDVPAPPAFAPERASPSGVRAEVVSYSDDRRTRGLRALAEHAGRSGTAAIAGLREVAPDFADWVVDFAYGDVLSRPGLDPRARQLATIAALTAIGHARPQLETHIDGALEVGCPPTEIIEVILQMAVYAGFPAAINALEIAKHRFAARGL